MTWIQLVIENRRKKIIASIKDICDNWYGKDTGIRRSKLGIYADERATFTYAGQHYRVGLDDIKTLSELGTDIIVVEKPNIARKLERFSNQLGIALLDCSGNFVEYAIDLCEEARLTGARVFLFVDCDIPGIAMALRIPFAKHIGLDLATLRALGINESDVGEYYEPSESQYNFVEDKYKFYKRAIKEGDVTNLIASGNYTIGDNGDFDQEEYEDRTNLIHYNVPLLKKLAENDVLWKYIKHRRIELDIFIEDDKLDLEVLWNYLLGQMLSYYPTRDYNRAIEFPSAFNCKLISDHINKLYYMTQPIVDKKLSDVSIELEEYEGFTVVNEKKNEIAEGCNAHLCLNLKVKKLMERLKRVMDDPKFKTLTKPEG